MTTYQISQNSFSFTNEFFCSHQLIPYASIFLGKEKDAPLLTLHKTASELGEVPCQTFLGAGTRYSFCYTDESRQHCLTVHYSVVEHDSQCHALLLDMIYTNRSDAAVYLNRFGFQHKQGETLVCSGNADQWFLGFGASLGESLKSQNQLTQEMWAAFQMPCPPLPQDEQYTDGRWRIFSGQDSSEFLPLYAKDQELGLFIAPTGDPVAFLSHECFVEVNSQQEGTIRHHTFCDMSNVLIQPGQSRASQQMMIAIAAYDHIFPTVLGHLAHSHGCRNTKKAAVGWCSWYDLGDKITEESITKTIDAIASHKDRIPMSVIQIDDGFQRTVGDWEVNDKFPNGWTPIIEKIKSSGSTAGIWLAPAAVHVNAPVFTEHPEWIMKDEEGNYSGFANNWGPTSYWLDFSNPKAYAFAMDIVRKERERGFGYFKIDFNTIEANGKCGYASDMTSLELYRYVYKGYREMIGEESYLCSCSQFTRGTFGYADSSRISPDSAPIWKAAHPCCLTACLKIVGHSTYGNGIIYANDPDVTYLATTGVSTEELQTWHSMVGLLGGVQMVSDPIWKEDRQNALRMFEILNPPAPEKGHPLHPATDPDNKRFGFVANRPYGDFASCMIYNPADEAAVIPSELNQLSRIGKAFHVWSFWEQSYLGVLGCNFPLELSAHACKLLRFTPVATAMEPILIGSDLHISMGAAEVQDILYGNNSVELRLNPAAGARDGALYLYSPCQPTGCSFTGCKNAFFTKERNVVKISIIGREWNGIQKVTIYF